MAYDENPTVQQLLDPDWWAKNAPSDEYKWYFIDSSGMIASCFNRLEGGEYYVDDEGVVWCGIHELDKDTIVYKRPEPLHKEGWDGNGVPPVGTICEAYHDSNGSWYRVTILAHRVSESVVKFACCTSEDEYGDGLLFWAWDVRPFNEKMALVNLITAIIESHTSVEAAKKLIDEGYIKIT